MPYIETTASIAISGRKEQAIKERMGKAIELIPGKSEGWLMLSFRDNVSMYFKGEDDPCAICQVKLFGSADEEAYAALTEALTDILHEELDLDPDRIYVTYEEIGVWGWNGGNF
ncbi:MAG: tautomerase family protein [Clostridia bacterium]|nr:tautomerase family protein [Clostridia bacterium]